MMKRLVFGLVLISAQGFAVITNPDKAAQDLCDIEWQITERASSTEQSVPVIVEEAKDRFKSLGYSFSEFSIDEEDFTNFSIEGATNSREMYRKMEGYTFADGRDMFKERMMNVCVPNVLSRLDKSH